MLIRFAVENFRSIYETVEVSFVAYDRGREDSRQLVGLDQDLLTVAGVFGPNAAGKSNVLQAVDWLRHGVRSSLTAWDEGIPVEPFAMAEVSTSSFSVDFAAVGTRFTYELDVSASDIAYEALFHYPKGRRRRVFERDGNALTLQDGLGKLSGVRQLMTPRSLVLSLARRFDEQLTTAAWEQLAGMSSLGLKRRRRGIYPFLPGLGVTPRSMRPSIKLFEPAPVEYPGTEPLFELAEYGTTSRKAERERALALLMMADLGVVDVELVEDQRGDIRAKRPMLVHSFGDNRMPMEFEEESEGTRQWFALLAPLLQALDRGGVLIFDEMDASLHPKLTAEILRLFREPATNPRGAQLLFTSHDPSLLGNLNRDQIWLAEKSSKGQTDLFPVSDFGGDEARRSHNLEKRYLDGRFGALPHIDMSEVYRALGAID